MKRFLVARAGLALAVLTLWGGTSLLTAQVGADALSGATTADVMPLGSTPRPSTSVSPSATRLTGTVAVDAWGTMTLTVGKAKYQLSLANPGATLVKSGSTVTVEGQVLSNSTQSVPTFRVDRLTLGGKTAISRLQQPVGYDREDEHGDRGDQREGGGRRGDDD